MSIPIPQPITTSVDLSHWSSLMRSACVTLSTSSRHTIGAVSVMNRLSDGAAELALLQVLAQRLAEEYELQAEAEVEDGWFTVRFSRLL
jgi:hypothetical protein